MIAFNSLDEGKVVSVLQQHAPDFVVNSEEDGDDSAVLDYVVQILSDSDSFSDADALKDTLAPFFGDDLLVATRIIEALSSQAKIADETTISPKTFEASSEANFTKETKEADPQEHLAEAATVSSSEEERSDEPIPNISAAPSSKKEKRKARRERKKKSPVSLRNEETVEDDASAWQECKEQGQVWGGRGRGGRGEYSGAVNNVKSNIHLSNVTVSLPNGADLLSNATMDIQRGHRYGLVGRNGVGKSTLLKRLAEKAVPGMPHDMRILIVQQQVEGSDKSPVQVLLEADIDRTELLEEQSRLETLLEAPGEMTETELATAAERLGNIVGELDAIGADEAEERALEILKGLQFSSEMLEGPTHNLSGGWRMRLALARSLFVKSDLLLMDEATNHIDLAGLDWLIRYLSQDNDRTMILVSHDRSFLDAVCTDIMHLIHQGLRYHAGNFSEFERQEAEKSAREARVLDDAERRRSKAQAFVQKQQAMANKKSADPNKQRQAKMIKEKKLDRIGNYREDGKRYKLNSMKKLSENYVRTAQKVEIEVDDPIIKLHFPDPEWPNGIAQGDPIIQLDEFSFGYHDGTRVLSKNTLSLQRGSKVALVGKNGAGKSTLVRLLAGELNSTQYASSGELWMANIRIGYVSQYSVEELEQYADMTVVSYAEEKLRHGKASSAVLSKASGNVRQYLGAFGLGGKHALQPIGKLSGGERMRLCFATILAEEPHLLLLDESTNHCDYETLDSMSQALNEFKGSVLMVSHNQSFLSGFCKELWVLDDGRICVNHSDTASFDELFAQYRSAETGGSGGLSARRQEQANLAKRAAKQRANTRQNTALL